MNPDEQPNGLTVAGETPTQEQESFSGNSANGAAVIERQPTLSRVTPEEAANLPYDELRKRMLAEARLAADGLLPDAPGGEQEGAPEADADAESVGAGDNRGARQPAQEQPNPNPQQGGGTSQQDGNQSRLAQLESELARVRQETQQREQQAQQQALLAQHQRIEADIARLPEAQRAIARQNYANQLQQQQLNDYYGFLQQRENAIAQQELQQTKRYMASSLGSLAEFVANSHGIKPDVLNTYVASEDVQQLIARVGDNQSLESTMHSISQTLAWMASQEAQRLQAQREQRRERDANRVQRDMPQQARSQAAGGGIDDVARIENMSREEFFQWKRDELRKAQQGSAVAY